MPSPALTHPIALYRPGEETVGPTGERSTSYTRVFAKAALVSGAGGVVENSEAVLPDRTREYVIRHMSGVSLDWYLEDEEQHYKITEVTPVPGRRRGFIRLRATYTREVPDNG